MFTGYLQPRFKRPTHLGQILPWADLPDPNDGLVSTYDEAMFRVLRLVPRDLSHLSITEQANTIHQLNDAWRRMIFPYAAWLDAQQVPAILPARSEPSPYDLANLLDDDARDAYERPGELWQTERYLSIWYRPSGMLDSAVEHLLFTSDGEPTPAWHETKERFDTFVDGFADLLKASLEDVSPLSPNDTLTYLHNLVSDTPHPVEITDIPDHLNVWLADTPMTKTGMRPMLGDQHVRCVSVHFFPKFTTVRMLDALRSLPFGHRSVIRWIPKSRETATKELKSHKDDIKSLAFSVRAMMYQILSGAASSQGHKNVERQANDTDDLMDAVGSNLVMLGDCSLTVVLMDEDLKTINEQVRDVRRIIHAAGCVSILERMNTVEAWLGTMPGLPLMNVRRYKLTTYNKLQLGAWSHPWQGQLDTSHLHAPPLTVLRTNRCQIYRLSPAVDDVMNFLVSGPIGSGKSTLLCWLAVQWLVRYEGAQLFWLDVKRAARCLILCLGGHYYDIGQDGTEFQPLAHIDRRDEWEWGNVWVGDRARQVEGLIFDEVAQKYIAESLDTMARRPIRERTISQLREDMQGHSRYREREFGRMSPEERRRILAQHAKIKDSLLPYTKGQMAGFMDGNRDGIEEGAIQCFELLRLFSMPDFVVATSAHIWHRLYGKLDAGRPTLFNRDEVGFSLNHPSYRAEIFQGVRLGRDKNLAMGLASQDLSDFIDDASGDILQANCPTRYFLPNPAANDRDMKEAYLAMGVRPAGIQEIATGRGKGDVYIQQRGIGEAMVNSRLTELAQLICGRSRAQDHHRMDRILAKAGKEEFGENWLRSFDRDDEAAYLAKCRKDRIDDEPDVFPRVLASATR